VDEEGVEEERDLKSFTMLDTTPGSSHRTLLMVSSTSNISDGSFIPIISAPLIEKRVTNTGVWVMRVVGILSFNNTSNSPHVPNTCPWFQPKSQYSNCSLEEGDSVEMKTSITSSHKVNGEIVGDSEGREVGDWEIDGKRVGKKVSVDRGVTGTRVGKKVGWTDGKKDGEKVGNREGRHDGRKVGKREGKAEGEKLG
jgi:hypothetical protein